MCTLWIVYTCGQMNVHVMNSIYMWTKWMCMLWIVYTCGLNECACYE